MRHLLFEQSESHSIAILVKATAFKKHEIEAHYVEPLVAQGIPRKDLIAFTVKYDANDKAPAKLIKEYLDHLLPALASLQVKHLYVTDANYFKILTKQSKAEPHFGYVLPCAYPGGEGMDVVLGLNYHQLIYNPDLQAKLTLSLDTLVSQVTGQYQALGSTIIHSATYPEGSESIQEALNSLHQYPSLTCDIETRSLRFNEAGIETIAFGLDKHNGIAFRVEKDRAYEDALNIKRLLKQFFTDYKGKVIYHNSTYDIQVLIYELWMKPL